MTNKKEAERGNVRQDDIQAKGTIHASCEKCKLFPDKIAVLTKKPRIIGGFSTRLLEITRESFRLEKHGLRHVSGALFKVDRPNYRTAQQFFCEVSV